MPRTRGGFRTQVFERYQRRQAALDAAISDMFVFGASAARVGEVVETLTGEQSSPFTASWVIHTLEAEFEVWKNRPLAARCVYAFADGTYFTVIFDGEGQKMPVLAVIGINAPGVREVLAFTVGERDASPPGRLGRLVGATEDPRPPAGRPVGHRRQPGDTQCGPAQVLGVDPPAQYQVQNG